MKRNEFRMKILDKYRNITDFCDDVGYTRQQVSNILVGRVNGGLDFWKLAQKKLNLSDAEAWRFQSNGVNIDEQNK